MPTLNMPVFDKVSIIPLPIVAGNKYRVEVVVSDSPVTLYEVSVFSDSIYSDEVKPGWP